MFPNRGLTIGKLFGVEIALDWSLVLIFLLITVSLGGSVFPTWHPDWTAAMTWTTAGATALVFFLSILLHELAHALVANAYDLRVNRITLFLFGGMASVELEPSRPREEALMAIVGPIVSIALGFGFLYAAAVMISTSGMDPQAEPVEWLKSMGPFETLLAWLGPVNILVGLFNLLPGYPLDGGRVLRAALWALTGDVVSATRWASALGRLMGWALVFCGVAMAFGVQIPFFGTGFASGLWLAFIGLFLSNVAAASYRQLLFRGALQGVPVERMMRRIVPPHVPSSMPLSQFVEERAMGSGSSLFPVAEGDQRVGVLWPTDVNRVAPEKWISTTVGAIATRDADGLPRVLPEDDGPTLLRELTQTGRDQLPVLGEEGELVGCVGWEDVARWVDLHRAEGASHGLRGSDWNPSRPQRI